MSTVVAPSDESVAPPSDERLHRLAVEAAKYLGKEVGEPLPTTEVVAQGDANRYDESDIWDWLEAEGLDGRSEILVPPQGDVLGELWRVEDSATKAPTPSDKIKKFRDWCKDKRLSRQEKYDDGIYQHPVEHAYSYKSELRKSARFKDVERYFLDAYPTLTTVLLTYTRPRCEDESIVEHADKFYPEYPIQKKRRDCIKATGYWEEFAGVSLLAPKDVAPNPCAETTHAHDMIVIPTFISSECFDPLREEGVDVSIRYHRSDKVEAPSSINRLDLEKERGATTALAQEVGANLPVLTAIETFRDTVEMDASTNSARYKAKLDATHCPEYVERWCAHMSCGKNGEPDSNGVRRWRPLGRFSEIADSMKEERGYLAESVGAKESSSAESNASESCEGRGSSGENTPTESRFTLIDGRGNRITQ